MNQIQNMTKVVLRGDVARGLLKKGFQIVDIKARKENPQSSVFVFKIEEGFEEAFEELNSVKINYQK